jgi:hypothetical protein
MPLYRHRKQNSRFYVPATSVTQLAVKVRWDVARTPEAARCLMERRHSDVVKQENGAFGGC